MLQDNLVKVAMQKRDGFLGAPSPFLFSRPFELRSPTWSSTQKIGSRMAPKCLEELRNIPPLPAELTALALKLPNWITRFTQIFKIPCSFLSLMRKCKGVGNRLRLNLCLRDAHLGMDLAEYIATGLNLQHCLMSSSWCWSWCLKAQSHLEANTHSSSTRFINIAQNKNALEIIYIYINFFIYGTSLHSTPPAPRFQMQSPPASAHPRKNRHVLESLKDPPHLDPSQPLILRLKGGPRLSENASTNLRTFQHRPQTYTKFEMNDKWFVWFKWFQCWNFAFRFEKKPNLTDVPSIHN